MSFVRGDKVFVKPFRRNGIVQRQTKPGHYRVTLGATVVTVEAGQLGAAHDEQTGGVKLEGSKDRISVNARMPSPGQLERPLDLHGKRVAEALIAVEEQLDLALRAGVDRFEVVHGNGGGAIRNALHKFLARSTVVKHFKLAEGNTGSTWIFL